MNREMGVFLRAMHACQTPNTAVMRDALLARRSLSAPASNYLTYLAGFTHHAEARPVLGRFGISLAVNQCLVRDRRRGVWQAKILILDLDDRLPCLDPRRIARDRNLRLFRNFVRPKGEAGAYLPRRHRVPNMSYPDYLRWVAALTAGLSEEVVTLIDPVSSAEQLACQVVRIPARNTNENLSRAFSNVTAVIAHWDDFHGHNTSVEKLQGTPGVWPAVRAAQWTILPSGKEGTLLDFLKSIGAERVRVVDIDAASDPVTQVVQDIRASLCRHLLQMGIANADGP